MSKPLKLGLKLLLICAVATLVLAFTNKNTAPVIAEAKKQKQEAAMKAVYPDADSIEDVEDDSIINENILTAGKAMVGGEVDGYVFIVDSPSGYSGPVNFAIGTKTDGTVTGFQVISHSESQGFGSQVEEPEYAAGMEGVSLAEPVHAEGSGGGPDVVPAMTGATLTTNAMVGGYNAVVEALDALNGQN